MARAAWLVMVPLTVDVLRAPGDELAGLAHPPGSRVGMVAELPCHPGDAAANAELLHDVAECRGHHVSGRIV
jgi:hypothetical protein